MAQQRSRLRGDIGFRKLIRRLPPAAKRDMADMLGGVGQELLQAMRGDVPIRTGALKGGLASKLLKASLRLRVGLVGTPRGRARLFYGWIVELGRKAQVVNVTRRQNTAPYKMRVRAMAPRPFVLKKRPQLREGLNQRIRSFWDRTLADASSGIDSE